MERNRASDAIADFTTCVPFYFSEVMCSKSEECDKYVDNSGSNVIT